MKYINFSRVPVGLQLKSCVSPHSASRCYCTAEHISG